MKNFLFNAIYVGLSKYKKMCLKSWKITISKEFAQKMHENFGRYFIWIKYFFFAQFLIFCFWRFYTMKKMVQKLNCKTKQNL